MSFEKMQTAHSRSMRIRVALIGMAFIASFAGLIGCADITSQGSSSSSASSHATSSTANESLSMTVSDIGANGQSSDGKLTIGPTSATSAFTTIDNELGGTVTNVALCATGTSGTPVFLMAEDQTWENGTKAIVNYEKRAAGVKYDIHVQMGDTNYVLHNIDLEVVPEVTMRIDNGIAYSEYVQDGVEVNTLHDETGIARRAGTLPSQTQQASSDVIPVVAPTEPAQDEQAPETQPAEEATQPEDQPAPAEEGEPDGEVVEEAYSDGGSVEEVYEEPANNEEPNQDSGNGETNNEGE